MSPMGGFGPGGLGGSMGPSPGACLQQRESPSMGGAMGGYCMSRTPSYDLGIGYGARPSPCSPTQPYQMNGHQYAAANGTNSGTTGKLNIFYSVFRPVNVKNCLFLGLISPGVSVPIAVPGQTDMTSQYWPRIQ